MIARLVRALVLAVALAAPAAAQDAPPLPAPPPDTLARACAGDAFRAFDFWLGRWRVGPVGRPAGAVNEITRVGQGCALQERYHNAGGYTGTSLNFVDRATGRWHQIWVDNSGLVLRLEGGLDDEGRMVLAGDRTDRDGSAVRDRITWIAQEDGTVHQVWDVSKDGGATWENAFHGVYTRIDDD